MKLLVCGGRDFTDRDFLFRCLDAADAKRQVFLLIHGAADGADSLAEEWAVSRGVSVARVQAEWKLYGRAAGPMRNQAMIDIYAPDGVVAFPGGRGTADMVARSKAAGIPVWQPVR